MITSRITGIASRGGVILGQWMAHHHQQNFLDEHFDEMAQRSLPSMT